MVVLRNSSKSESAWRQVYYRASYSLTNFHHMAQRTTLWFSLMLPCFLRRLAQSHNDVFNAGNMKGVGSLFSSKFGLPGMIGSGRLAYRSEERRLDPLKVVSLRMTFPTFPQIWGRTWGCSPIDCQTDRLQLQILQPLYRYGVR